MERKKEWNRPPVVRQVFFDDFSSGIRTEVWRALDEKWASQNNNGYSEKNCLYTTRPDVVAAAGGTGGIVVIRSNGDFAAEEGQKRQGGGIVTKRLFGPGLYETRVKVVPRVGQCSAMWTYYNNWAPTLEKRRYSEIDIELPHGGDYRRWSGTTYQNYLDGERKTARSEVIESSVPLNDGKWHTLAFEWRTDKAHGDEAVVWYQDGKEVLRIEEAVPHFTATFWVASLFQDAIAWLGDPQFERAYMYVDWVRISEYDDPVGPGSAEKESKLTFTGCDLGDSPLPETEYLANAYFLRPAATKNFKGREICSWETENGEICEGALRLNGGGRASQFIAAQYSGYAFEAEICGKSKGQVCVYLEYLTGEANRIDPQLKPAGRSAALRLKPGEGSAKGILTIEERKTEHVRFVIEAAEEAEIREVHLRLV